MTYPRMVVICPDCGCLYNPYEGECPDCWWDDGEPQEVDGDNL